MMKIIPLSIVVALAIVACTAYHKTSAVVPPVAGDTPAATPLDDDSSGFDWYGDSASELVRLDQGWTVADSNWFYWTTQGSQLLPYVFFLALEQPNERTCAAT